MVTHAVSALHCIRGEDRASALPRRCAADLVRACLAALRLAGDAREGDDARRGKRLLPHLNGVEAACKVRRLLDRAASALLLIPLWTPPPRGRWHAPWLTRWATLTR